MSEMEAIGGFTVRILTMIVGILFAVTGAWCLANPGTTFLSLAFVIGLVMLIFGICAIFTYRNIKKEKNKYTLTSGWILIEAILSTVLACLVLSNQLTADAMVPLFFGMWTMFSGVLRIAAALFIKDVEKGFDWIWMLSLGAFGVLIGIYAFVNPMMAGLSVMTIVGICFLVQGINIFTTGLRLRTKGKYKIMK